MITRRHERIVRDPENKSLYESIHRCVEAAIASFMVEAEIDIGLSRAPLFWSLNLPSRKDLVPPGQGPIAHL